MRSTSVQGFSTEQATVKTELHSESVPDAKSPRICTSSPNRRSLAVPGRRTTRADRREGRIRPGMIYRSSRTCLKSSPQAITSRTTFPWTSVSRKSRPE